MFEKLQFTIRNYFKLVLAILLSVSIGLVIYFFFTLNVRTMRNLSEQKILSEVSGLSNQIESELEKAHSDLLQLKTLLVYGLGTTEKNNPIITDQIISDFSLEILKKSINYSGFYTVIPISISQKYNLEQHNLDNKDYYNYYAPYFIKGQRGGIRKAHVQDQDSKELIDLYNQIKDHKKTTFHFPLNRNNNMLLSIAEPLIIDNQFVGLCGIDLDQKILKNLLEKFLATYPDAEIRIVNNEGVVVASNKQDESLTGMKIASMDLEYNKRLQNIYKGIESLSTTRKEVQINLPVYLNNNNAPWALTFNLPKSVAYSTHTNSLLMRIGTILLIIIISYLAGQYALGRIYRAILGLHSITRSLAEGKLQTSVLPSRILEIKKINHHLNQITNKLQHIKENAIEVTKGNYSTGLHTNNEEDELFAAINNMNKTLKKNEESSKKQFIEVEQRNWGRQGISEFSQILRDNNDNISELSKNILEKFVSFLGIEQAGLFILNDENPDDVYLELISAYAYNREKRMKKTVKPGEGLIGACFMEKRIINLTEIPQDYIQIKSGLGEANPQNLVLAPLKNEDKVLGVLELSSFKRFEEHELIFLESVSESIAITLTTANINTKTAILLEQSRNQAMQLESREQELRQNIEELHATQEESKIREAEMRGILNAINANNLVIELDINGQITSSNDAILNLFEISKTEMLQLRHDQISPLADDKAFYENFWHDLTQGIARKESEKFVINEKTLWFESTYSPILDVNKNIIKILVISNNISDTHLLRERLNVLEEEKARIKEQHNQNLHEVTEQYKIVKEQQLEALELIDAIDKTIYRLEYDRDGRVLFANKRYLQTMGYRMEELSGTNIRNGIAKKDMEEFETNWERVLSGVTRERIIKLKNKADREMWLAISDIPVFNKAGEVNKVVFLGVDISSQKQMEIKAKEQSMDSAIEMKKIQQSLIELESEYNQLVSREKKLVAEIEKLKSK